MLLDYHIHTTRCRHAEGTMEEYLREARKLRISEIGFSDHCPYLREFRYSIPTAGIAMPVAEFDDYMRDVTRIKKNSKIPVKLGLEIDYLPDDFRVFSFINRHRFDYFIGSVHFIDDWGFDQEEFSRTFSTGDNIWIRYLKLVEAMARTGLFDIVGHLDLPKKFGNKPGRKMKPFFLKTLKAIKLADMAVEVNTGGMDRPVKEFYPSPDILKMCFDLGIPVTLGSDSHKPEHVGRHFEKAKKILMKIGYQNLVSYTGHLYRKVEL